MGTLSLAFYNVQTFRILQFQLVPRYVSSSSRDIGKLPLCRPARVRRTVYIMFSSEVSGVSAIGHILQQHDTYCIFANTSRSFSENSSNEA